MTRLSLLRAAALISVVLVASAPGCSQESRELTEAERELLAEVGFRDAALRAAIASIGGPVHRLVGLSDEREAVPAAGVSVEIPGEHVESERARLREALVPLGFGVFHAEQHFGYEPDRLAIVASADPYAFLRLVRIDGINYDLEHEAVVAKLREWDGQYGLDYIGASQEWVSARFRTRPTDMAAFAAEVYAFCPGVVDQGTETVEALAQEMRRSGTLYCWWD